jgi:hypothetical protein
MCGGLLQLFSSSYEGVLRCLDVERAIFQEVGRLDQHFLAYTGMDWERSIAYGCTGEGILALTDWRAGKQPQQLRQLHERKISHVDVHPTVSPWPRGCCATEQRR